MAQESKGELSVENLKWKNSSKHTVFCKEKWEMLVYDFMMTTLDL